MRDRWKSGRSNCPKKNQISKLNFGNVGKASDNDHGRRSRCRIAPPPALAAAQPQQPQQPRYLGEAAETPGSTATSLELLFPATTLRAAIPQQTPQAVAIPNHRDSHCPIAPYHARGSQPVRASSPLQRCPAHRRGSSEATSGLGERRAKKPPSLRLATAPSSALAEPLNAERCASARAPKARQHISSFPHHFSNPPPSHSSLWRPRSSPGASTQAPCSRCCSPAPRHALPSAPPTGAPLPPSSSPHNRPHLPPSSHTSAAAHLSPSPGTPTRQQPRHCALRRRRRQHSHPATTLLASLRALAPSALRPHRSRRCPRVASFIVPPPSQAEHRRRHHQHSYSATAPLASQQS